MKLFLSTVGIILSSLFCACIAFHPQLLLQQPSSHGINSNGVNYGPNTRVHVVQFASAGGGPAVIERETTVIETTGPAVLDRPTTTTTIELEPIGRLGTVRRKVTNHGRYAYITTV